MKHNYKKPVYPVPILSKKNVRVIEKIINEKNIDFIIEYGSGYSTMYFIKNLKRKKIKFISVENTKFWFYENMRIISKDFNTKNCVLHKSYWSSKDYEKFYKTSTKPFTEIINGKSRIEKIKKIVKLGPFYRFEKDGNSKLSGKLSIFLPMIKPIFILINSLLQKVNFFNNEKSEWKCQIDELDFTYKLISPSFKDQFGESPNKDEYANAGIEFIANENKNILVMIDGGPRHYIADRIINEKYKHNLHICLFDAHRPEYKFLFDKYKGTFFQGEEELVDGTNYYSIFNDEQKKKLLSKELWYYKNLN